MSSLLVLRYPEVDGGVSDTRMRVTKLHSGAMGDAIRVLLAAATKRHLTAEEYAVAEAMVAEFERRARRHA